MMERSHILEAMGELKLYGMRNAYDEIIAAAIKRQHEPTRVVGSLLVAEINEKKARSIKYQMTIPKPAHTGCREKRHWCGGAWIAGRARLAYRLGNRAMPA